MRPMFLLLLATTLLAAPAAGWAADRTDTAAATDTVVKSSDTAESDEENIAATIIKMRAIQVGLENLADVFMQLKLGQTMTTEAIKIRSETELRNIRSSHCWECSDLPQQRRFDETVDRAWGDVNGIKTISIDAAGFQEKLGQVLIDGDAFLRACAERLVPRQEATARAKRKALRTMSPEQIRRLGAIFDSRNPDEGIPVPIGAPDHTLASNEVRRNAYLKTLLTPSRLGDQRLVSPSLPSPPPGKHMSDLDIVGNYDMQISVLAALARLPIMSDWVEPRLKDILATRYELYFATHNAGADKLEPPSCGFTDFYEQPLELEDIADRYLLLELKFQQVLESKPPNKESLSNHVHIFLKDVVTARGHVEVEPETIWEKVRQGKLLDSEEYRWNPYQRRSAIITRNSILTRNSTLMLTGCYRDWADLDHFAQALGDTIAYNDTHLLAIGYWIATVSNIGWTSGKAVGIIGGSKPDWKQFDAAQRGSAYAEILRRNGYDLTKAIQSRTGKGPPDVL